MRHILATANTFIVLLFVLLTAGVCRGQDRPLIAAGSPAVMADLDGDEKPDRIRLTGTSSVQLDLTREPKRIRLAGTTEHRGAVLALVDFDHDLDLDLILTVPGLLLNVQIWINEPQGQFRSHESSSDDAFTAARLLEVPNGAPTADLPTPAKRGVVVDCDSRSSGSGVPAPRGSSPQAVGCTPRLCETDVFGTTLPRAPPARA